MRLPEEPESPLQINIVPMIDVVFAVLIFFIVASLFLTRTEELPVDLPNAATGVPPSQAPVGVTIDSQGSLAVNGQPTSLDRLADTVSVLIEPAGTVVIQADQQVNHGRVIAVMDRLRSIEGASIAIATQPLPLPSP